MTMVFSPSRGWTDAERDQLRYLDIPRVVPTAIRLSAGVTTTLQKGNVKTDIAAGTANRFAEYPFFQNVDDNPFEIRGGDVTSVASRFRAFIGTYFTVNATATTFAGIEMGTFGTAPPFAASPTIAIAQLRRRMTDDQIEFLTAVGDGTPAQVVAYNLGAISPHGVVLELEHEPGKAVSAFVDGKLLERRTTTVPLFGSFPSPDLLIGVFMTTGTNVAAAATTWWGGMELRLRIPN